jgi:hypothetical protein
MFVAAFVDPERKGESFQGIAERLGFFVTGIGYTLLALTAVNLLLGDEPPSRRGGRQLEALMRRVRRGSDSGATRGGDALLVHRT